MSRRKYPFYSPIKHRVVDGVRRDVSTSINGFIRSLFGVVVLWIGAFLCWKLLEYGATKEGAQIEPVTFSDYWNGTVHVLKWFGQALVDFLLFIMAKGV